MPRPICLYMAWANKPIAEIARRLGKRAKHKRIDRYSGYGIRNTRNSADYENAITLPSLSRAGTADSDLVMAAQKLYQQEAHPAGKAVMQEQDPGKIVGTAACRAAEY